MFLAERRPPPLKYYYYWCGFVKDIWPPPPKVGGPFNSGSIWSSVSNTVFPLSLCCEWRFIAIKSSMFLNSALCTIGSFYWLIQSSFVLVSILADLVTSIGPLGIVPEMTLCILLLPWDKRSCIELTWPPRKKLGYSSEGRPGDYFYWSL